MPKAKVLIIDYEPKGIKQLSEPLEAEGHAIVVAKDGVAGIEAFKDERPDIVLIEAMLPKRHGFEVCQELKRTEHGRKTPVVIVTSVYKGRKYRTQAIHQYNCDEYLEKPIAPDKLVETVHRLLGSKALSSAVAPSPARQPAELAGPAPAVKSTSSAKPDAARPADPAEVEIVERLNDIFGERAEHSEKSGSAG